MNKIFFKKSKKFIFIKDIFIICNYLERKFYNQKIFDVNNVQDAKVGDVTFFNDLKYENDIKITKASACIVNKNLVKFLKYTCLKKGIWNLNNMLGVKPKNILCNKKDYWYTY